MKNIEIKNKEKYIYIILEISIVIGALLHIAPYFFERSLWMDEAMLASSILTRDLKDLVASPLDWGQSAPIGYLYAVKIITLIFGDSVGALRAFSLITGLLSILLVYLILKNKVQKHYALLFTAIYSVADKYIYYANELKQYMCDNFFSLLVLYIWQKYQDKKIPLWVMLVAFSIIIWFSFTAVFFIGACMIILCISLLKKIVINKDKKQVLNIVMCLSVLISFVLNYIFWLSKTSANVGEAGYWKLLKFPIIPRSINDLKLIPIMLEELISFWSILIGIIFVILFVFKCYDVIKEKKDESKIFAPFCVSLVLMLIASSLGFYPMQDRLVQTFGIILLLIAATSCDKIEVLYKKHFKNTKFLFVMYLILAVCLYSTQFEGMKNLKASHVYIDHSEVQGNFEYMQENIAESDHIYIFYESIPVFEYLMKYQTPLITGSNIELPYEYKNTIYGQKFIKHLYEKPYSYNYRELEYAIEEDANLISQYDTVYIFISHSGYGAITLANKLRETGEVKIVNIVYTTAILLYTKNK